MSVPVYMLSESESDSNPEDGDLDNFFLCNSDMLIKPKVSKKSSPTKSKSNDKIQKEKLEMSENKQLKLERKQKIQEEKLKLKAERKKVAEKLKQLKPGECMKFIFTFIDSSLVNQKFGGELLTALQSAEIKYTVREQEIPNTISWVRNVDEINENVLNYITVVWMWNELVALISSNTLNSTVRSFITSHSKDKITIVIFGIEEYFRRQKTKNNREMKSGVSNDQVSTKRKKDNSVQNIPQLSRIDVEMAMGELQLLLNVQYKFVESGDELGLLIAQSTKVIAELPYKLQRNKTQENTDWYAAADSRDSVRVDGNGNGLLRLWQQQICQFPNVGLDVAQAIVSEYKSPRVLMEAYDECTAQRDAELLLQNIPIRRAVGPLSSVRRIGPELSKKIYAFFNSTNGNVLLNQEN